MDEADVSRKRRMKEALTQMLGEGRIILVTGNRGGGKCVGPDTRILLPDGRWPAASQVVAAREAAVVGLRRDGFVSLPAVAHYELPSDGMVRVETRTGRSILVTPEHPLLTPLGWVPAAKLLPGSDFIATPRELDVWGTKKMEDEELKLLAYMIGDGHCGPQVSFTNADREVVEDFAGALKALGEKSGVAMDMVAHGPYTHRVVKRNRRHGTMARSPLMTFLETHGLYGSRSRTKFIPTAVFTSTRSNVSVFLRCLFSTDGYVNKLGRISYSSTSRRLVEEVRHLLLRFGILSQLTSGTKTCTNSKTRASCISYQVNITDGDSAGKFSREIGIVGARSRRLDTTAHTANSTLNVIPMSFIDAIGIQQQNKSLYRRGIRHTAPTFRPKYGMTRQKLQRILDEGCLRIDNPELAREVLKAPILWDLVTSASSVEYSGPVYDITVPEVHNFLANDIVSHNTHLAMVLADWFLHHDGWVLSNVLINVKGEGSRWGDKEGYPPRYIKVTTLAQFFLVLSEIFHENPEAKVLWIIDEGAVSLESASFQDFLSRSMVKVGTLIRKFGASMEFISIRPELMIKKLRSEEGLLDIRLAKEPHLMQKYAADLLRARYEIRTLVLVEWPERGLNFVPVLVPRTERMATSREDCKVGSMYFDTKGAASFDSGIHPVTHKKFNFNELVAVLGIYPSNQYPTLLYKFMHEDPTPMVQQALLARGAIPTIDVNPEDLAEDDEGGEEGATNDPESHKKRQIVELLQGHSGWSLSLIAREVGVTRQYVHKVKKECDRLGIDEVMAELDRRSHLGQ